MNISKKSKTTLKITYSAICIALALVLPFITGHIPEIGNALCPMHIPVIICGFLCGRQYGLTVGFVSPLLRCMLFNMPSPLFPRAISMAFELATYGFIAGLLYKLLPKKIQYTYISLISAMICGRISWGVSQFLIAGFKNTTFTFSKFIAGAIIESIPGIVIQILLIPIIVEALKKANLVPNDNLK